MVLGCTARCLHKRLRGGPVTKWEIPFNRYEQESVRVVEHRDGYEPRWRTSVLPGTGQGHVGGQYRYVFISPAEHVGSRPTLHLCSAMETGLKIRQAAPAVLRISVQADRRQDDRHLEHNGHQPPSNIARP